MAEKDIFKCRVISENVDSFRIKAVDTENRTAYAEIEKSHLDQYGIGFGDRFTMTVDPDEKKISFKKLSPPTKAELEALDKEVQALLDELLPDELLEELEKFEEMDLEELKRLQPFLPHHRKA